MKSPASSQKTRHAKVCQTKPPTLPLSLRPFFPVNGRRKEEKWHRCWSSFQSIPPHPNLFYVALSAADEGICAIWQNDRGKFRMESSRSVRCSVRKGRVWVGAEYGGEPKICRGEDGAWLSYYHGGGEAMSECSRKGKRRGREVSVWWFSSPTQLIFFASFSLWLYYFFSSNKQIEKTFGAISIDFRHENSMPLLPHPCGSFPFTLLGIGVHAGMSSPESRIYRSDVCAHGNFKAVQQRATII